MKKSLYLLFIPFFCFNSFGQQATTDSLYQKLRVLNKVDSKYELMLKELCELSKNEYDELNCELSKIRRNWVNKNYDSVIIKSKVVLKENELVKSDKTKAFQVYNFLRASYYRLRKADSVLFYSKKLLEVSTTKEDEFFSSNKIAQIYFIKRNYKQSLQYLEKNLDIIDSINNKKNKAEFYLNLGETQKRLELYDLAINNFNKALDINQEIKNYTEIGNSYKELGRTYELLKDLDKAKKYLQKALLNFKKIANNSRSVGIILDDLSDIYIKLEDYNKALAYANESLKFKQENNYDKDLRFSYSRIGRLNYLIKNPNLDKSVAYLKKAKKMYLETQEVGQANAVDLYLFNAYLKKKDIDSSRKYIKEYLRVLDSLEDYETQKLIAEIDTKYQTEKKEKEILQLESDKAKQKLQSANERWILFIIIIATLTTAFFIWKRYKSEAKAKQTISDQKDVIEELQKELHHRVKNNLNIIDAFVDEIKDDYEDSELEVKLEELQNRIASINEVHTQLYQSTDVTNVNLKKYIERLAQNVASTYNNKNVTVNQHINQDLKLQADKSSVLGLIINEFLTNSYKYAFESEGEIKVNINETEDDYILNLSDNGKGLPKDFDVKKVGSYGMRIMRLLSRQLKGTFDLKNNNGVELNIQFPKA